MFLFLFCSVGSWGPSTLTINRWGHASRVLGVHVAQDHMHTAKVWKVGSEALPGESFGNEVLSPQQAGLVRRRLPLKWGWCMLRGQRPKGTAVPVAVRSLLAVTGTFEGQGECGPHLPSLRVAMPYGGCHAWNQERVVLLTLCRVRAKSRMRSHLGTLVFMMVNRVAQLRHFSFEVEQTNACPSSYPYHHPFLCSLWSPRRW